MAVQTAETWVDEPRSDTGDKVTGAAVYVEDMPELAGSLYAAPLQSPYAHARIRGLDASAALRLPGTIAVLDGSRLAEYGLSAPRSPDLDPVCLVTDKARFEGDLLAVVVARDLRTARRAVELIDVDYELLTPLFRAEDALQPGAPLIHEALGSNSIFDDSLEWGDVEQGFREADTVVAASYFSPTVFHHPMEPIGTGLVDFTGDTALIWAPTNTPVRDAHGVAQFFGLRREQVRLRVPCVGGGFGAKKVTREMVAGLALSRKLGRPIKLVATGGQSFGVAVRHAMTYRGRMGLTRDGRIVALDVDLSVDCGAYFTGGRVATHNATTASWGCYRIPHFRARAQTAFTNKTPATPHRGTGKTQTTYAIEALVDQAARQVGIDTVEFRRKNVLLPGDCLPERWRMRGEEIPTNVPPLDVDFPELMHKALIALGDVPSPLTSPDIRAGRGVAICLRNVSKGDQEAVAMATLDKEGTVTISHNATDLGQGIYNMLGIVAARSLGLPRSQVRVEAPDTTHDLPFAGSSAQRVTVEMGSAVRAACENLEEQLIDLAVESIGGDPAGWWLANGKLWRGEESYSLADIVRLAQAVEIRAIGSDTAPEMTDQAFGGFKHWSPGVAAVDLDVDAGTGEIRLLQYAIVTDAGTVLHRKSAEGQVQGGAVMGLGIALCEELVYEEGQTQNADAFQYRLPLMRDIPERMPASFIENSDGPGPFGSKGVSQTSIPCVSPAIGNAIADAIGAPLESTPFTPEKILRALGTLPTSE